MENKITTVQISENCRKKLAEVQKTLNTHNLQEGMMPARLTLGETVEKLVIDKMQEEKKNAQD